MDRVESMTGFASLEGRLPAADGAEGEGGTFSWDARSVNNRALDVKLRLPAGFERLEADVRRRVSDAFARGSLQLSLQVSRAARPGRYVVNEPQLAAYLETIRRLEREHGLKRPRADAVLALKGVVEVAEEPGPASEAEAAAILAALGDLLARLSAARREEGARIAATLSGHLDAIGTLVAKVEARAAAVPALLGERLSARIDELLAGTPGLSPERLHQEAALLAVKADVREELDRLAAHVAAARDLLAAGGAIGRRLDFLAQEFNREANTVLSKAADGEITEAGLALKARIEQMREQVQNVE